MQRVIHLLATLIIGLLPAVSQAENRCSMLFQQQEGRSFEERAQVAEKEFQARADALEQKLRELKEPGAPFRILSGLRRRGSPLDLEIFETLVEIHRNSTGRIDTVASPLNPATRRSQRPSTAVFQQKHLEWSDMQGYFFTSPYGLSFTKQRDLEYLRHVLSVAQAYASSSQPRSLKAIALVSDYTWHLANLKAVPELARRFTEWMHGYSYLERHRLFAADARGWLYSAKDPQEQEGRTRFLEHSYYEMAQRLSAFDLFLMDRYFQMVKKLDAGIPTHVKGVDMTMQMSRWEALKEGVASGSLDYLIEFLGEKGHDSAPKIFLLRVLDRMEKLIESDHASLSTERFARFGEVYREAFRQIEEATPDAPVPEEFATDLHIFSPTGDVLFEAHESGQFRRGLIWNPRATHALVSWNSKFGRLQANVLDSAAIPRADMTLADVFPGLKSLFSHFFDVLRAQPKTFSRHQVDSHESRELNSMAARMTYFFSMERGHFSKDHLIAMSRSFYGGPRTLGWTAQPHPVTVGGSDTMIEGDVMNIALPERKTQSHDVYEWGRLMTTAKAAPFSRYGMVQIMADHLLNSGARGTVYMDGGAETAQLYRRMGASDFARPNEVVMRPGFQPVWIQRAPVMLLKLDYAKSNYRAIRLRKPDKLPQLAN